MTTDALLSLTLTAIELAVGIVILLRNPHNDAHRLFFSFVTLFSLWGIADAGLSLTQDRLIVSLLYRFGIVGFCLSPVFYLHFMAKFTNSPSPRWRRMFSIVLYGTGLAFSIFLLGNSAAGGDSIVGFSSSLRVHGFVADAIWPAMFIIASAALLVGRLQSTTLPREARTAMKVLLGGILGLAVVRIVGDAFAPINGFRPILPGRLGGLVIVGCSAFALIRFRGMIPTSEAVAEKVLDSLNDLVCLVDMDGVLKFSSKVFRDTLDVHQPDSITRISDFVEEGDQLLALIQKGPALQQPMSLEVRYKTRSGAVFPVLLSIVCLPLEDAPPALVLIGRDITERRELARKVEESEEKYRHIVESSIDGIVIIQDGGLAFVNPSAVKIFGYSSAAEMMGTSFDETVAPGSRPFLLRDHDQRRLGDDIFSNYEMKGLTKAGKTVDLEINAKLVSWNSKPAVQASFRDITERKALEREQALWFWEQESLRTIDRQLAAMVDLESVLSTVSRNARAFSRADFSGVIFVQEAKTYQWRGVKGNRHDIQSIDFPLTAAHKKLFETGKPLVIESLESDPAFPHEELPLLTAEELLTVGSFPFRIRDDLQGVLVVGFRTRHQISDREIRLLASLAEKAAIAAANAELYEELREREDELRRLTNARVEAQEDERRRIAREIHDGLGQMLSAIKFNVEVLEDSAGLETSDRKKLLEVKGLLDSVMTEAREISYNLMPSVLEDFGLVPALQMLTESFSSRRNLKTALHAHGVNGRLDPAVEINLYRIVQEALNNIAKHAEATSVELQILRTETGLQVTIEDDGKGFLRTERLKEPGGKGGMGLVSMRQRASTFGGVLTIDSSPGKGTSIIVEIPYSHLEHNEPNNNSPR